MTDMEEQEADTLLNRTQKRLLRRLYNGRTVPVIADDKPFLTYKEAVRHLNALPPEQRETVYAEMKAFARNGKD